jgi:hypothetical protein
LQSPREIFQVLPSLFLKVELFEGSKRVWPLADEDDAVKDDSSVLQSQLSAEPVSKSRLKI